MRDQPVKLVVLVLLGLVLPAAYARPHTRAVRAAGKTHSAAASAGRAKPHQPAASTAKAKPHQHPGKNRQAEAAATPAAVTAHTDPPLPEMHVTHDRKVHLKPGVALPDAAAEQKSAVPAPRKASNADFLGAASPNAYPAAPPVVAVVLPRPAEAPAPGRIEKARLPRQIFRVVSVAPDPVTVVMPALYTRRGRLIVPPAMKGSHEILLHQNEMADQEGLIRVQDDEDLGRLRAAKMLVPIPVGGGLAVDERLPANRRYCRPWTAKFLVALARAHEARFHSPLQVNSAVRTVEVQQRLLETNGNAAPAEGSTASPHLTGQAVDIAKHGLSMAEIAWLRGYLLPLVQQGRVDVEEEFQQACFHISVYKRYAPEVAPKRTIQRHRSVTQVLAVALP